MYIMIPSSEGAGLLACTLLSLEGSHSVGPSQAPCPWRPKRLNRLVRFKTQAGDATLSILFLFENFSIIAWTQMKAT
jgi:hypothetical protein